MPATDGFTHNIVMWLLGYNELCSHLVLHINGHALNCCPAMSAKDQHCCPAAILSALHAQRMDIVRGGVKSEEEDFEVEDFFKKDMGKQKGPGYMERVGNRKPPIGRTVISKGKPSLNMSISVVSLPISQNTFIPFCR